MRVQSRGPRPTPASIALLWIFAVPACAVVVDFDYETDPGATGASTTTGSTGGGAAGGAGGALGGSGGELCTLPGDGPAASGQPWLVALGPIDPALDWPRQAQVSAQLIGDKIVFGVALYETGEPVRLGSRVIAEPPASGALVGWIDDGGTEADAWMLSTLTPAKDHDADPNRICSSPTGSHASIQIAPWKNREVLAAYSETAYGDTALVRLDLCDKTTEELWLRCGASGFPNLTTDPTSGRIALSLQLSGNPSCELHGPFEDCMVPAGATSGNITFHVEPGASGSICRSMHAGGNVQLLPDGQVVFAGIYDEQLFDPPFTLDTGAGPDLFHNFLGKMAPSGADLLLVDTMDLGESSLFETPNTLRFPVLVEGDSGAEPDVVLAMPISAPPQPDGSVLPPATQPNGFDIMVVRLSPQGAPVWGRMYGGAGVDAPGRLTRGDDGRLFLSGRTSGTGSFGSCEASGCAIFTPISETDGALGPTLLVQGTGGMFGDHGWAGWIVPGPDYLIVGSSDGAVTLPGGSVSAPPDCKYRNLWFAREPEP